MYFNVFIESSQVLYEVRMSIFAGGKMEVQRNSFIHSANTDWGAPVADTILVAEWMKSPYLHGAYSLVGQLDIKTNKSTT